VTPPPPPASACVCAWTLSAACWAISAVEAVGSAVAIVTGDLRAVQPGPSVQEVLDCNAHGLNCHTGGGPGTPSGP